MEEKIKILVVPSDTVSGVGFFRFIQPHVQLEKQFSETFNVTINAEFNWKNVEELLNYNIVITHNGVTYDIKSFQDAMLFCKERGITTIIDIDDYWDLDKTHPSYLTYKTYNISEKIKNNLSMVDYIVTTTDIFAQKIKKYNRNVIVLPNSINPEDERFKINREDSNRLRVGFVMGSSHENDMNLLKGVVNKIPKNILDKIQIVLCGYDTNGEMRYINPQTGETTKRPIKPMEGVWYRYEQCVTDNFNICSDEYIKFLHTFLKDVQYYNVKNEPYKRCWTKNINKYFEHYKEIDVLLVPLEENDFNSCKSQLKAVEAAFSNTAIIASNFGPYTIDLKHIFDKGGIVNNEGNAILIDKRKAHKDWVKYIVKCAENPSLVKTLRDRLQKTMCEDYDLRNVTIKRSDFYKSLVKK